MYFGVLVFYENVGGIWGHTRRKSCNHRWLWKYLVDIIISSHRHIYDYLLRRRFVRSASRSFHRHIDRRLFLLIPVVGKMSLENRIYVHTNTLHVKIYSYRKLMYPPPPGAPLESLTTEEEVSLMECVRLRWGCQYSFHKTAWPTHQDIAYDMQT